MLRISVSEIVTTFSFNWWRLLFAFINGDEIEPKTDRFLVMGTMRRRWRSSRMCHSTTCCGTFAWGEVCTCFVFLYGGPLGWTSITRFEEKVAVRSYWGQSCGIGLEGVIISHLWDMWLNKLFGRLASIWDRRTIRGWRHNRPKYLSRFFGTIDHHGGFYQWYRIEYADWVPASVARNAFISSDHLS
jgi:hypothetical protein